MKKLLLLIPLCIILILLFFNYEDSKLLKNTNNYSILSETAKTIPAKIYSRIDDVEVSGKMEKVFELVVFFDEDLKMELNPIVIVPKYKLIGRAEGGESYFIKFGNKIIQTSEEANTFTTLNSPYFEPDIPIKKQTFQENKITFNSFGNLTKYGKEIIINRK